MPKTLPNLYCTPQDVWEYAGADAVQLRSDDRNLATGQVVSLTAAAVSGATGLNIASLEYALLRGTVLVFEAAGMENPVEVTLTAAGALGATSLTVAAIGGAIPANARATDNGVNVWLAGLMAKGCKYATAQVKSYCCGRYNDSDLKNSWSVNRWTTILATRWVAKRRFNPAPQSIESDYVEAMQELREVRAGQLNIEDIGTRTAGWPFLSNLTLDDRMTYRKVRVEPAISEPTVTQYSQSVDWNGILAGFEY